MASNHERMYFIDGPAQGRTILRSGSPSLLTWDDADGATHPYRRMTHFRNAHFYRQVH